MNGLNLLTLQSFNLKPAAINTTVKISNPASKKKSTNPDLKNKNNLTINNDIITGSYTDDINIIELHNLIINNMLESKSEKLRALSLIKTEEEMKVRSPQTRVQRDCSIKRYQKANSDIDQLQNDVLLTAYVTESKQYLDAYNKIGPIKEILTFGKEIKIKNDEIESVKLERLKIIEHYLNVCKKYTKVDIYRNISSDYICEACGYNLSEVKVLEDNNIICPSCSIETVQILRYRHNELEEITGKSTNGYENRSNFQKRFWRFKGKVIGKGPPVNLEQTLDSYFISIGWGTSEEVRQNPKVSKNVMYLALKSKGLNGLYDDINLICHIYLGWELPDVDHLEELIFSKYDETQEIFEKIKGTRSSSLNTSYHLWWLLTECGYNCKPSDFKLPKTPEIFEYHESKRREICNILGWNYAELDINFIK